MMRSQRLLREVADLIGGDRDKQHGDKMSSFKHIARLWNAYINATVCEVSGISARDVAVMMALLKIGRMDYGDTNVDDFRDALGYLAIAGEIELPDLDDREHWSDCEVHNMPAKPNGPCDCGGYDPDYRSETEEAGERSDPTKKTVCECFVCGYSPPGSDNEQAPTTQTTIDDLKGDSDEDDEDICVRHAEDRTGEAPPHGKSGSIPNCS